MSEENTKTLYGNVNLNDYYFEWHSEPGACEKCQALDGKTFDDANTIPDKPHPNCKCWIERKKNPSTDPIQYHRDKIQEQKNLELEFEKLNGDLRCLEAECDKSIEIIDNELDTIEKFEYTINPEYLKPLDVEKVKEVKLELEKAKETQETELEQIKTIKAKIENSKVNDYIVKTSMLSNPQLSIILATLNKEIREFMAVRIVDKYGATLYGKIHSIIYKMPEAYRLFRIGLEQDKDKQNRKYIEKNGVLLDSVHDLNSPENEELIIKRIQSEHPNIEDSKVLVLHEDSSISKAVVKSAAFEKFIKENFDKIFSSKGLTHKEIEFKTNDSDLLSTFHGAEIYDAYIDNEGNLIMRLEDYYNFNRDRNSVKGRVGYKLQVQGELEPYYVIVLIKVPKEKLMKYLNEKL